MEIDTKKEDQEIESLGQKRLEEGYKPTFFLQTKLKKMILLDLIYSVIIGVTGGIISSLIPFSLLIKVWYPLTGGTQLVSGHHVIWATIIYGLTKKKYNIYLTMITKGILEFLFADPWGLLIIFVNLMEAFFLTLGFFIVESVGEGDTKLGWGIAGGFGNFFQAPFFWILNQRFYLHWSLWALAFIFAFVSGILITGLLGRTVKNYLIKAGVPSTAIPVELTYKKLTSDDLPGYKEQKLWSIEASINITIYSYLLMFFSTFILVMLLVVVLPINLLGILSNPYFFIISSCVEINLILLPLWYVGKYLKTPNMKNRFGLLGITLKGLSKKFGLVKEIILGILFSFIALILVFSISFIFKMLSELIFGVDIIRNISSEAGIPFASLDFTSLILIIIMMILVIGVSEEILFRGFLQKGLMHRIGKRWGIIITAIIFTLFHMINIFVLYPLGSIYFIASFILSFFPYFAISLLLGYIYYWRKENLIAVIFTHGFYDILLILLTILPFLEFH